MRGDVMQRPSTSAVLGCAGLLLLAHSCPSSRQPQPLSLLQCGTAQPCLMPLSLSFCPTLPHFPQLCAVFYTIWRPFMFLVGYTDPRRPGGDRMYGERCLTACLPACLPSRLPTQQLGGIIVASTFFTLCPFPQGPTHCLAGCACSPPAASPSASRVVLPLLLGPLHLDLRHDVRFHAPKVRPPTVAVAVPTRSPIGRALAPPAARSQR